MDNYVQTLLKTQTAENRADIVACLKQLDGIDSIKPSKDFLTVTLSSGKKHRLKGDFYNEKFEIGSYSEHLRAAAENRATANELAAALTDADQLRATYRAKREAYHQQHHAFTQRTADDNSPRAASTLDFDSVKNLSPQAIQTLTTSYTEQIQVLQAQLCNIDISSIETVTTNINSFSTSIEALQEHINSQVKSLKIDQKSLQNSIQAQVRQAIANQSEQIQSDIQTLITEKLSTQRATYLLYGIIVFGVLILLMNFLLSYQASSNLKTITAQREVIQQNSQIISNQNSNMN